MLVEVVLPVVVAVVVLAASGRMWYLYSAGRCSSTRSMAGKTVIVTGGTAAELQADVGSAGEVLVRRLDTSDLASVRTFAKEMLDAEKAIHVLVNNAGISSPEEREVTVDGLEMTMATNHFGHFLLTNLLLDRLKESAPSRVVNVSSIGHKWVSKFDVNDLTLCNPYNPAQAYCTSKLCNILFTRELADRLAGTGVTVNSLHPGVVKTDILNYLSLSFKTFVARFFFNLFGKDANSGAQTTIHLAVSEDMEGVTGRYFVDCKEAPTSKLARRKDLATGLWEVSAQTVGL